MRTDVKLGMVVAMVVVSVAGGYYMYRDRAQQPIFLGGQDAAAKQAKTNPVNTPPKSPSHAGQSRGALAQGKNRAPQRLTQPGTAGKTSQAKRPVRAAGPRKTARNGGAAKTARRKGARQNLASRNSGQQNSATRRLAQGASRGGNRNRSGSASPRPGAATAQRYGQRANPNRGESGREHIAKSTPKLPPVTPRGTTSPTASHRPEPRPVALTAVAPASIAVEKHRVQPGDSLSSLALQYYGSEKHTRLLIDANRQLADPNRLKIGEIVNLPPVPKADNAPESVRSLRQSGGKVVGGARTYTVRSGDSFYLIAKTQLGDASRWKELYELNRSVVGGEPKALRVGQVLTLPR